MTDPDQTDPAQAGNPPAQTATVKVTGISGRPTSLGIYDKPRPETITSIEILALALSGVWLLGAAFFFLILRDESSGDESAQSLRFLMTMLAIFMPVAMIWVAATAAKASRVMREESQRLQSSIDAIRQAYITQQQGQNNRTEPSVTRKLDEIAAAARKTETALATFQSRRDESGRPKAPPEPTKAGDDQPALALGTQAADMAPLLSNDDFIRALNFPETAEDEVGFASLRRALKDRSTSQLVQASQDVLTLMSQDGIYMDDLRPDRARPEVWRHFAQGARGRAIAPLGGIRDRSSLALTNARMKQDPIFRDAAHHFLRRFDQTFSGFEKTASDTEISALSDTRTARAFMLLGRCAGTFD
ncbi:hypothetical protein HKX54_13905 [Sulfitobacter sp. M57]|uniref:hypothetical protein n=1 Tax=unclassified Sulfitobacter TaxID=196795 RepID=UPI0023E2A7B9|nr:MULTISPECIES: hypothetical protein [unclassified Sulfitobacter]MDF3415560.1 hypothetical protein [Sulfitobacter sp. KE5]MDF3423041.1 hypothetical protein [Sulfitobacter sp. KE43]MDF3434106.1 hypothetical protein [Sulfitobacter sp. KE42]MDF3459861.1 hypothetical protein [Sulfitobacter sp. S74]MDF3463645.1 hypothetical protein [Sulfitobacter sp. Ks18]